MSAVPVGLQSLMPEQGIWGEAQLNVEPAEPAPVVPRIPALVRAGDAEVGVVLEMVDSPQGWDFTLGGGVGGLELFQFARDVDGALQSQLIGASREASAVLWTSCWLAESCLALYKRRSRAAATW